MPIFQYTATDQTGAQSQGTFEAADERQAYDQLAQYGLSASQIVPLEPVAAEPKVAAIPAVAPPIQPDSSSAKTSKAKGKVTKTKPTKGKKKKNEEEEVDEADINLPNKPKNAIRKPKIDSKPTMKEGLRQAMSAPKETSAQMQKRQEKDNFDLYKKRQARVSALRGDRSSRQLTKKQQKDYETRVNLDQLKALDPGGKRKKWNLISVKTNMAKPKASKM